jgi:hypothetical protein
MPPAGDSDQLAGRGLSPMTPRTEGRLGTLPVRGVIT